MTSFLSGATQAFAQGLYEDSATPQHKIGELAILSDGRKFRYVKCGATGVLAGKLYQGPDVVANHQNIAVTTAAAGATTVTVTLGATLATINQYAGGYIAINAGTGLGQTYKIKSHPAAAQNATLVLTLEDPLVTAVATSDSKACLMASKFNGVIVHPTTFTNAPAGVGVYPITALYYGWLQTYGPVSCLNDSATAVGLGLTPSASVAGAVKTGATTLNHIGSALQAGVTTEYRLIQIMLD